MSKLLHLLFPLALAFVAAMLGIAIIYESYLGLAINCLLICLLVYKYVQFLLICREWQYEEEWE